MYLVQEVVVGRAALVVQVAQEAAVVAARLAEAGRGEQLHGRPPLGRGGGGAVGGVLNDGEDDQWGCMVLTNIINADHFACHRDCGY